MQTRPAIILLGGQGTRIRHLFPDLPKALIPVAGRPFLAWQLDWLFRNKIDSVRLAAGYQAEKIQAWVARRAFPAKVKIMIERQPLGTAGALKFAARSLPAGACWVLNGDSLLPRLNFKQMEETHRESGALATLAVATLEDAGRYGAIRFDDKDKILSFNEKGKSGAGWVNAGVYLIAPALLSRIAPDQPVSIEREIFPELVSEGKLFVFKTAPPLLDMGTPEGLAAMEKYLRG